MLFGHRIRVHDESTLARKKFDINEVHGYIHAVA
jgi:hypothetical protein